jgi:hypothetical protein
VAGRLGDVSARRMEFVPVSVFMARQALKAVELDLER